MAEVKAEVEAKTRVPKGNCKDGSCLTRKGAQYRAKWLKQAHLGTERDGYRYSAGYAPTGQATCRLCKAKIAKGSLRVGRSTPNPWDAEGGQSDYTRFFHAEHAFEAFSRSRCDSRVPLRLSDFAGADRLAPGDTLAGVPLAGPLLLALAGVLLVEQLVAYSASYHTSRRGPSAR